MKTNRRAIAITLQQTCQISADPSQLNFIAPAVSRIKDEKFIEANCNEQVYSI